MQCNPCTLPSWVEVYPVSRLPDSEINEEAREIINMYIFLKLVQKKNDISNIVKTMLQS